MKLGNPLQQPIEKLQERKKYSWRNSYLPNHLPIPICRGIHYRNKLLMFTNE